MKSKFFELAKSMASRSVHQHRMGAVIARKNRLIGCGFNKPTKTHPKSNTAFNTIHAELDAIIGTNRGHLKGSTIYVLRILADGSPAMARPCEGCWALLREYGVKKVFYTTNEGYQMERVT